MESESMLTPRGKSHLPEKLSSEEDWTCYSKSVLGFKTEILWYGIEDWNYRKSERKTYCVCQTYSYNQSDSLHKLNRSEQVILFRLRTSHNRLNAHMYNKFKVGESEMCPCNADIMTAEHPLQHCQLHDALTWDVWPEPTLLWDKLYDNLEELRTATFVRATGFSI